MPIDFIAEEPAIDFQPEAGGDGIDFQPEQAGTLAGIGGSFQRGRMAGQRAIEALQFQDERPTMRQERRGFVSAMQDPEYQTRLMEAGEDPEALARVESLYGPGRRVKGMTEGARQLNVATAENVAQLSKGIEAIPQSEAMAEWSKANNSDWWKVFARNPVEITANIFAESIPQAAGAMAAGIAGGAAGGPGGAALGAGTGSFAVEASNALLDSAAKQGVDLKDPEQVRAFFADESKVKQAREYALQRGFPIALFDALTAGVAGKFLKPALGGGLAKVAGATGLELGSQMAGGAAGETAAQLATGEKLNLRDIAAEAIGELVTAPTEAYSNLRSEIDFRPEVAKPIQRDEVRSAGLGETPANVSPDALAELQASLRGESPGSRRLKGALQPAKPERATPTVEPQTVVVEREAELTPEQREAIEFQRSTDEAVRRELERPGKDYSGMSRLELELLEGMGDAGALAEQRKRRARREQTERDRREQESQIEPESTSQAADFVPEVEQSPMSLENEAGKQPEGSESRPGQSATPSQIPVDQSVLESIKPYTHPLSHGRRTDFFVGDNKYEMQFISMHPDKYDYESGMDLHERFALGFFKETGHPLHLIEFSLEHLDKGKTFIPLEDQRRYGVAGVGNARSVFRAAQALVARRANVTWNGGITFSAKEAPRKRLYERLVKQIASGNHGWKGFASPDTTGPRFFMLVKEEDAQAALDLSRDLNVKLQPMDEHRPSSSRGEPSAQAVEKSTIGSPKDAVESALDKLKLEQPPGLQAFGLVPDLWNRLIEAVRIAYRAGKSVAEAIDTGIQWLKEQTTDTFDESAVRAELSKILEGDGTKGGKLRAQIANLDAEMRAIEASGRTIPDEMIERYKSLADELGEEIRGGRATRGAVRTPVDDNLRQRARSGGPSRETGTDPGSGRPAGAALTPSAPSGRIPQFSGPERLPHGRLRDLMTGLQNWRRRAGNWLSRRASMSEIIVGRDAADNRAAQAANQASLHVRLILNRAFDTAPKEVRSKHELRESALTFVVEANGDRAAMSEYYDAISGSEFGETAAGRQALKAIEYADLHWDKFETAAAEYRTLTETEREAELNEGVNSHEWRGGYVYHRWKREQVGSGADPTTPRPAGTPFRNTRSVATYAEGIAQGRQPTTLNAMELLAERVAAGQRRMNELSWVHGLRDLIDPVTDEPVVTDVIRKPRRPLALEGREQEEGGESFEEGYKPEWVTSAPEGYQLFRLGDLEVAAKEGFSSLLTKLTSPSFFKGAGAKKVFGFVKSALLLFDTFHMGRMVAWRQMFGLFGGYQKGQTLLDFSASDLREMAARGEIPESWVDGLIENKRRLAMAVDTGFNIGNVLDNSWGDVLHHLPGIGTFNKWLFGQYQRGAMAEAWLIEFQRLRKARPDETERATARRVSRDLNTRFGNLGRQGLFKSRTAQDLARFVFLAPQWNESLIRAEIGSYAQAIKAPFESVQKRRIVAGTLMKATGMMALGTFLANQILNYAFRGKATWENEEEGFDKKISAHIPDAIGGGPGMFLNPLALPAEYTHLIEGNLHRSGGDWSEAFLRIFNSRLHSIARAGSIFLSRRDVLGQKLRDGEVLPAMGKAMIPVPIAVPSVAAAGKELITGQPSEKYPGQYQKQILSSFGIKTDQAPSAEQRVRNLARDFNKEKGIVPNAEFYTGDYDDFTKALRIGNQNDAASALEELLKKKTPRQVYDHFKRWSAAPFTGQRGREKEFWRGLTPEQRERYTEARKARQKLALEAVGMLRQSVTK